MGGGLLHSKAKDATTRRAGTRGKAGGPSQIERLSRLNDFFRSISPQLAAILSTAAARERVRASDVFLWATLSGHDDLADTLWELCEDPFDPLLMAMLGAHCCRIAAFKIGNEQAARAMLLRAVEHEKKMLGVMDAVRGAELSMIASDCF